ncbi:MAG: hypothetical protein HOD92_14100 [Deltaproteobacteria bacterium]|jgi:hypothetical protein|nr:hypothetical protein [Deltaproteobacteria bacterium]
MKTQQIDLTSVEQAIKKIRKFTIQDIAGQTGFSTFETKIGVETLMKKYSCQMQVTDQGELIYDFGSLVRRGNKTLKEQLDEIGKLLWKGFTYFFKVWIMLMLVGYFAAFVVLLLAIAIGSMFAGDRDEGVSLDSGIFTLILRVLAEFFFWKTITGNLTYRHDRHGYRYRQYEPSTSKLFKSKKKSKKKKFIISVFDYVFGPHRAEIHPFENQREVATYIRENKGIITIEEVRALAGWKDDKAGEFFTEMISSFDGEIKVSEQGVIYGEFTEFMSGKHSEKSTDIVFFWDEFEPEYALNGNSTQSNMIITGMNLFVLLMSYGVLNSQSGINVTGQFILGIIPFVYSCLFFLIPLIRSVTNSIFEKQRSINNIRKRLMKEIFLNSIAKIPLEQLDQSLNSSEEITDKVNEKDIKQVMSDEINDWKGELLVDDNAALVYDFTLLRESQTEMLHMRAQRKISVTTGQTVFDTGVN